MAQSETLEDFNSIYDELTSKWSANVKADFNKRLKEDLMTYSGSLKKFQAYTTPFRE